MDDTVNAPLSEPHRERLLAAGVGASTLGADRWSRISASLPPWWHDYGNALYCSAGAGVPQHVLESLALFPVRDVLMVIGSHLELLSSLLIGGDAATVFVGAGCALTAAEIYCGADSSIVLQGSVVATRAAVLDARNGGSIVADHDQLWAANVYLATDDMHRLEDRHTGVRLNPYGAHIRLARHVWLCREAVLTGEVDVGEGSVVGMRSIVRGQKVPDHCVVAGSPARIVREEVIWSHQDLP